MIGNGDQRGYTLVLVLILMDLVLLMILSVADIALMERSTSVSSRDMEQAFQLAEGAAYLGMEQSYALLADDYRSVEILPACIVLPQTVFTDHAGGKTLHMRLQHPRLVEQSSDGCIYEMICQGTCGPAEYKLKVEVGYEYLQCYTEVYREDGSPPLMSFSHREHLDRGNFIKFERL